MIDVSYILAGTASVTACTVIGLALRSAIDRMDERRIRRRKTR
jgi:hypothetical protein